MRKRDRHQLIKKMITEEKLSTQKEIQDRLEAHNVFVTQTTLSRDLREIGLTKVKKNDMVYYVLANETEKIDNNIFLFANMLVSIVFFFSDNSLQYLSRNGRFIKEKVDVRSRCNNLFKCLAINFFS